MMKWIFAGLILLSVLFGALNGRLPQVSIAALEACGGAVELTLTLMGSMCLWSGLMKIADRAGVTDRVGHGFRPLIRWLFPGLDSRSPAAKAITMNLSANLLGLGNAATPLGIAAMKELQALNRDPMTASNYMAVFVVLNTASMQLIPTTTAMLRQQAGSQTPLDILPAVWVASLASVLSGILMCKLLERFTPGRRRHDS